MIFRLPALIATCLLAIHPAAAEEKLTVLLDWFVNPDHGPLYVAQERGYFSDAGLTVEFVPPADPNDPPKLVAAGKADLAISYQPQLHIQAEAGLPLVRIATLVATPLNTILVLKDSPVRTLADLKGKRVGFSVAGLEDALLAGVLQPHGLTMDDIVKVNVNWSLSPSLISGRVDAVIGAFRNFELNQMDIAGHPGRAFYLEEEGVPSYDELIVVAHRDTLDRPAYRAFVDAMERGIQYMINHPDEAWKLFIAGSRKDLDDELNRRAWRDTLPRFALRPAALDRRRYERFAEFVLERGLVESLPPVETYAVELQ
ncbi:MAG: ABC transporter substrate-binding protein [Alphaproteobacteria bacterium]|nr:ABC transporter substrate-binding protein [Alphaproteobacteria bacterium]MCY4231474.1 ABC transporter substrate-binding protein [Alphaproteobacteria bacterium]MCY4320681.1 ABC transporter substrate-binding protein [Alphaproteobacteria bacterium]